MLARTATEQSRLETMVEIQQIKEKLAKDGKPVSMTQLQNALMIPEDIECKPSMKMYPDPAAALL